ncbi:kallikrein-11-like [Hypanus sabinus]|uniref:kallikrein-11-like n=1 Tax=Hypanus sabinus TaxID=79690 RepID=UPI0028C417DB|nr:kallikrein-11-like [Hypanus sabinus]
MMKYQAVFSAMTIIFYLAACCDCSEIIGGKEVRNHSKPYMASIQMKGQHMCGGVLIKPSWILTAAHCNLFFKQRQVHVVLGIDSLSSNEISQQVLNVKRKIPHECFEVESKENDIMLLQLETEAKLNKFVGLLPLPQEVSDLKEGTVCTVAGWGTTKANSKKASDWLREADVTIIDRKTCNSRKYYNRQPLITENMLCAGDKKGKRDACSGDSGGPLVCKKQLRGIVSYGKGCGLPKKPGVYTRITNKYIQWIRRLIDCDCSEIIGGKKVRNHSKPYMASIQMKGQHMCGGVLIKPSWILTAAHCNLGFKRNQVRVVLGIDSLGSNETSKQVLNVKYKIPHECFDIKSKENDIMLLQLESEAKLNEYVGLLPLPREASDLKDQTVCTVAGWGATKSNSDKASDCLREANVTIIDRKKCNSRKYYDHQPLITENMLCAGDKKEGRDACFGDSGGPLVCNKQLRGIVSFGYKKTCGLPKKPGVYTRITEEYIQWIQKLTD